MLCFLEEMAGLGPPFLLESLKAQTWPDGRVQANAAIYAFVLAWACSVRVRHKRALSDGDRFMIALLNSLPGYEPVADSILRTVRVFYTGRRKELLLRYLVFYFSDVIFFFEYE
ncbi:hypothetical protein ACFFU8_08080 [Chromobacterium piscinae]|uniref:hypothetical protein n=1 Tax=Chromobacterium piscinae TaxID=686831 RepID=UPI001E5E4544|nr:hypothetical protein [Chromobacterium piscinae]MCD5329840.1 hypothetical protein [Chromobacterium piscinae]